MPVFAKISNNAFFRFFYMLQRVRYKKRHFDHLKSGVDLFVKIIIQVIEEHRSQPLIFISTSSKPNNILGIDTAQLIRDKTIPDLKLTSQQLLVLSCSVPRGCKKNDQGHIYIL